MRIFSILENSTNYEQRCSDYENYLSQHIKNVQKSWYECLRDKIKDIALRDAVDVLINEHDSSKYAKEEWTAYLDYFYPGSGKSQDEIDLNFKYAWLHHQHCNPHHWQYWLLKEDESDKIEALDMPIEHVLCMLCDWHSFRYVDNSKTTQQWYDENKSKMILSDKTRELVHVYLPYMVVLTESN